MSFIFLNVYIRNEGRFQIYELHCAIKEKNNSRGRQKGENDQVRVTNKIEKLW